MSNKPNFVKNLKIGDVVLVPGKSKFKFLWDLAKKKI